MRARRLKGEEGQVFPALLLVVVVLLFAGLAIGQLGSASDQHGQTQTAADAAAVAAAQQMLAQAILLDGPTGLPPGLANHLHLTGDATLPSIAACNAANRNWTSNSHRTATLNCPATLSVQLAANHADVDLQPPAGDIVSGPAADTSDQATEAGARADVVFDHCPDSGRYGNLGAKILGVVVDHTARALGLPDPGCGPPGLDKLLEPSPIPVSPAPSPTSTASPSPLPLPTPSPVDLSGVPTGGSAYDAVADSFRIEIVD